MTYSSFSLSCDDTPQARGLLERLLPLASSPEQADVTVVIGGDGFMLQTLRNNYGQTKPFYGLHSGDVGFLMNSDRNFIKDPLKALNEAVMTALSPLQAEADGHTAYAVNEVAICRASPQAVDLQIYIDGQMRLEHFAGDGILVATPAGSTAYNQSAHGPIIPLGAPLLALTPLNSYRPRYWRGALLPDQSCIDIVNAAPSKRPATVTTDNFECGRFERLRIMKDRTYYYRLLFDPGLHLEERIITRQFAGADYHHGFEPAS